MTIILLMYIYDWYEEEYKAQQKQAKVDAFNKLKDVEIRMENIDNRFTAVQERGRELQRLLELAISDDKKLITGLDELIEIQRKLKTLDQIKPDHRP